MTRKLACVLLLLLMATLPLQTPTEAQAVPVMTISMGGIVRTNLVAGVYHNISFSLAQAPDHVALRAHLSVGFAAANSTNNYSWSYSSGVWADDLYDYYIQDSSARYGNVYCFQVVLDSLAVPGQWRFSIWADGAEVSTRQVTVEAPRAGIAMSAPTFHFNVIPYGTGYISSWNPDNASSSQYLTTRNDGNVPLTFSITFERSSVFVSSSSLGATNSTGTALPNEQRRHYIDFQAQSWSPRKFTVTGYVSGEPQLVMTPGTVSTIVAPRTTFEIVVTVARPGFDVYQMDGVAVQFKRYYYSLSYKDRFTMDLYLTGNKSVYLGQEMQNLTFNAFRHDANDFKEDILLVLSDTVEQHVAVNITCSSQPPWKQPTMLAYANFDLRLADNTVTGRFTSNVVVQSSAVADSQSPITASMLVVIALIAVFLAIGIFLFKVYRKTEEERRRDLEDRIRKKKERAKKQRRR